MVSNLRQFLPVWMSCFTLFLSYVIRYRKLHGAFIISVDNQCQISFSEPCHIFYSNSVFLILQLGTRMFCLSSLPGKLLNARLWGYSAGGQDFPFFPPCCKSTLVKSQKQCLLTCLLEISSDQGHVSVFCVSFFQCLVLYNRIRNIYGVLTSLNTIQTYNLLEDPGNPLCSSFSSYILRNGR